MSKQFFKRNGATILTYAGGIGVIVTTVMAVKATPKALRYLEAAKEEKGEELTKAEVVKAAGPVYIPTALVGLGTLTCIFGANTLNKRQQASLVSAYALLDSSYKEYKNKAIELYGTEGDQKIREEVAKDNYEDQKPADDKELFYDEFSGRYFESDKYTVQHAEYRLNQELHSRGWVTINEFYEWLGMESIDGGDELGWSEGGNYEHYWQSWIDFTHHKTYIDDDLECIIVTMFQEPYLDHEDY
jgi:hypothetical protein